MATPQTNYTLIRYQADNIPLFDGNAKLISRFITACENFLSAHQDRTNPNAPLNIALFDTILSKLTGRAADLIASRIELNSWTLVKEAIYATFSDQRTSDCVMQDIVTMRPLKNENSLQFGIRLQDARSLLYSKVNASNESRDVKLLKINEYGKLTMKTFINGLDYHMQLVIRLKNPETLEEAMSYATEEENFIYFRNRHNINNKISPNSGSILPTNQNKNNFQHTQPTYRPILHKDSSVMHTYHPPIYRPTYNSFQQNPVPQFNSNMPRNNYQTGNNLMFKGYGQFKPGSNRTRIFNPNLVSPNTPNRSNQFRQTFNNNQNQNFNRSEPMDTSSGNTILNRAMQNKQNTQQRNFVSQELFNQSVESPLENINQPNYENFDPTYDENFLYNQPYESSEYNNSDYAYSNQYDSQNELLQQPNFENNGNFSTDLSNNYQT